MGTSLNHASPASTSPTLELSSGATTSWRNSVGVHPAADRIPVPSDDEKRELAVDLKRQGQRQPVVFVRVATRPKDPPQLLDGRTRLDLLSAAGVDVVDVNDKILVAHRVIQVADDAEAECLSFSLNVHRRHLSAEQKRDLIAKLLKADPNRSDRQIAGTVKASPTTVGTVGAEMEATGDVSKLDTRKDTEGRQQPANKPRKPTTKRKGPNLEPCDAEEAAATLAAAEAADAEKQSALAYGWLIANEKTRETFMRIERLQLIDDADRDDIGANSAPEVERLQAQIEELQCEVNELKAAASAAGSPDMLGVTQLVDLLERRLERDGINAAAPLQKLRKFIGKPKVTIDLKALPAAGAA